MPMHYLRSGIVDLPRYLIRMRDGDLLANNVNHYAVLGCAVFAAILAGLLGRHGSRLSAKGTIVRV
jgi:hypothetical protein